MGRAGEHAFHAEWAAVESPFTGRQPDRKESLFGHPGQQDTVGLEQLSSGKPSQIAEGTQIRAAFLAHHPSSTQKKEVKETSTELKVPCKNM